MADDLNRIRRELEDTDFRKVAREVLGQAAVRIGGTATTRFMRRGGPGASPRNPQTGRGSLRRRSGDLARSLTGARSASVGPGSVRGAPQGVFDLSPTSNGIRLEYGSEVEYAATHEYGDVRAVTSRQRRYFWWRYSETNEDRWKWMALSERLSYPKREYLEPSLERELPHIEKIAEDELIDALFGSD